MTAAIEPRLPTVTVVAEYGDERVPVEQAVADLADVLDSIIGQHFSNLPDMQLTYPVELLQLVARSLHRIPETIAVTT